MNITNKLFSLLGFSEPVSLLRFDGDNFLPKSVLVLTVQATAEPEKELSELLNKLSVTTFTTDKLPVENKVPAMIIDARNYQSTQSYEVLYQKVHQHIKLLAKNARIVVLAPCQKNENSSAENAFSRALLGFTKSLAKEVGRKGTTANIIYCDGTFENISDGLLTPLSSPLSFYLSSKSSFISGQALTVKNDVYTDDIAKGKSEGNNENKRKKVALVTGAAQGIGASIAKTLARDGFKVIGVDIEPAQDALGALMQQLDGLSLVLDISTDDAAKSMMAFLNQHQLSGLDVVVHNAGITRDKTIANMPEHWWSNTININLLSVMRINDYLIEHQGINTNGRIVCLSSMNGIAGQVGQTNYSTSKAGLIGYVESFAGSVSNQGITINAVAPGFIETKMTEQIPFVTREMGRRMNALGQGGKPIDVAEAIAFFADEKSSAITGQTLRVCGLNFIGA